MLEVQDNFLDKNSFDRIQHLIAPLSLHPNENPTFSWFYSIGIDFPEQVDRFQFTHSFYDHGTTQSPFTEWLDPILQKINPFAVSKIKANLLTNSSKIIKNGWHTDLDGLSGNPKLKEWTTGIFYLNTNNGYTEFKDGTKVESVANRFISFPANLEHRGTTCTDEMIRVILNLNYFI